MTDLDRLATPVRTFVDRSLQGLSYRGRASIRLVSSSTVEISSALFEDCSAVILRPTDRISISKSMFASSKPRVGLFTVSVGTDYLNRFKTDPQFEIFDTQPYNNARGVAAFNIMLASALFARLPINVNNINSKTFQCTTPQSNLVGKNWMILGSGQQVARLLEFGHRAGIEKFFIWNDQMDAHRFEGCFEQLKHWYPTLTINVTELKAELQIKTSSRENEYSKIEFFGGRNIEQFSSQADIVSLHMPHQSTSSEVRPANTGFIDMSVLRTFTKRPMLINTSRGELLNEKDVVRALQEGLLQGVAVDVLEGGVERDSKVENSDLWSIHCGPEGRSYNLIITPHLAGSADTDAFLMWQSIVDKLEDFSLRVATRD